MTPAGWDEESLLARIADPARRLRHPAGSPDAAEVAAYAAALPEGVPGPIVVLGMTPELRALAARRAERTLAIDVAERAIALYEDWLTPAERALETVVLADWRRLGDIVDEPVAAVIADGAFGNLPDEAAHRELLDTIGAVLAPGGRFVTRHALIPRGLRPADHAAGELLARFRAGEIDEAELGFGTRLLGHHACCYDPASGRLDNAKLFAEVDAARARGELTATEHAAICRYRFDGDNCILDQDSWERLLADCELTFSTSALRGREWYAYYPVYCCQVDDRDPRPTRDLAATA